MNIKKIFLTLLFLNLSFSVDVLKIEKNALEKINTGIVVLKFSMKNCQPCRRMLPMFHKLAAEFDSTTVKFYEVDVEKLPSLAQKFNVRSVPTIIVFNEGKILKRFVGGNTKTQDIWALLNSIID